MFGKNFRNLIAGDELRINMTELSRVTGVSTSQIRYWERKGYIHSKQDEKNKNHHFSFLTLLNVYTIKYYLDQGYTLSAAVDKERHHRELGKIFQSFLADRIKGVEQVDAGHGEISLGTLTNDPSREIYAVVDRQGTRLYSRPAVDGHPD